MPSDNDDRQPQPLAIRMAIALMLLLALSGLAMIGNGLYLLARAEVSKVFQNHAAEHHLARSRCKLSTCRDDVTRS